MTYEMHPIDGVNRLRIMAAGIRGARVAEQVVPAPADTVWAVMGDLEGEFGRFQPDMRSVRVLRRTGDRVEALARSKYGFRAHFRGVLRPGWCWLQSRFLIIGMAAAPEPGGGTRVALTGGVRVPGRAAIVPFGTARELADAMARLEARVEARVERRGAGAASG
ncbi:SRPBCC family protein [Streptomyces sp. NPDC097981]|uniref:SRPBCC family protein n=1 Tax=Streptomyces sp. NPDC097981 TaxID=3155428 RepID=UPI00332DF566